MNEALVELPPMDLEERKGFVERLFDKLAFLKGLQGSGLNVKAAEDAVNQQIRDTIQTGDPKKT